jgi:hypothetical protein
MGVLQQAMQNRIGISTTTDENAVELEQVMAHRRDVNQTN